MGTFRKVMQGRVAIGADHGGFILKGVIARYLAGKGVEVLDYGAQSAEPSDYPDYARAVSDAVRSGKAERGILICGSGVGASIAANKFPGIRAAVCHDSFSAHQGVEDDDMNVLCLGERIIGPELAKEVVDRFLAARFSGAERHVRRLGKVRKIEQEFMKS
jgi:ribose 5-phosphate isomerase B